MPDVQASLPWLPRYGESSLADLGSSVLASLGASGEPGVLGLPAAERVCVLVVDGLGWELLREHPAAAPFLSELAVGGRALSAGFPATTATSLASLGTGRPPGLHGVLGYQVAVPGEGRLLNALHWDARVDPVAWQPGSTIFERAVAAGIGAFRVGHSAFRQTGLSKAALRGVRYLAADTIGALVAQAAAALRRADRALVMVYHPDLDATGHVFGCSSDAWRYHLGHVDELAEQLAGALPPGTVLHVTGRSRDGGRAAAGPDGRGCACPSCGRGWRCWAVSRGPGTCTRRPGAAGDVLAAWREVLGHRAWVASREEAVADGWFGPVEALAGAADR